jgi:uncharacterized integral membrane protein
MKIRAILLLLVFFVIAVFAAVNWTAFTTPTTLSFVATSVEAPLGLILLGLMALLTIVFLAFASFLQTSVLLEARQHARELKAQRELAEKAETSRYTELRALLETRLLHLEDQSREVQAGVVKRLDQLDGEMRLALEQTGNTLAAYIGELEDRMTGESRIHPH